MSIGFTGSATFGLLPQTIRSFRQGFPGIRLRLQEMTNAELLSMVQVGQLDVGFVRIPASRPPEVQFEVLEKDVFCVALPPDHPLAKKSAITLRDLADQEFIGYVPSAVGGLHAACSALLQAANVAPRITQEVVQVATAIGLVGSGIGVALVPAANTKYYAANVEYRRVRDLPKSASIGIALAYRPENANPAVKHFRLSISKN
ncbi:MAG: LysR family substrate-binding domain-containing protein [Burkholderiaceae bacterium]